MDKGKLRDYNNKKGIKLHLLEVVKMSKLIDEVNAPMEKQMIFEEFKQLVQDKSPEEIVELFEANYAFQFGAPGSYLDELYKDGK